MRRTPLARKAPLRNRPTTGTWTPPEPVPMDLDAAAAALAHQQASAEAPRRTHAPVPDPQRADRPKVTGAFPPVVRQTIIDRDHMLCQRCGRQADATAHGYSMQHRNARGMGGTSDPRLARPSNGILLCGSGTTGCHGWVEANPEAAERLGLAVPSWADPESVPVLTFDGWVLLANNGAAYPCTPPTNGDALTSARRLAP